MRASRTIVRLRPRRVSSWCVVVFAGAAVGVIGGGCGGDDDDTGLFGGTAGAGGGFVTGGNGGSSSGKGGSSSGKGGSSTGKGGSSTGKGGSSTGKGGDGAGDSGSGGDSGAGGDEAGQGGSAAGTGGGSGKGGTAGTGGAGGNPFAGEDPTTCDEAAQKKTNVGCDFWPTVTPTSIWSIFDFAAVVANPGDVAADVIVTFAGSTVVTAKVPAHGSKTLYLPWVPELKGEDGDSCGSVVSLTASLSMKAGAYHLTSSRPVAAYQFSSLEYLPEGGPPGKDWSSCPGSQTCASTLTPTGCFSFTNDASLLLPTTALTGNYRVAGMKTQYFTDTFGTKTPGDSGTFTITATANDTNVKVKLGQNASVFQGGLVMAAQGNQTLAFSMGAGDVVTVVGTSALETDVSGSLVQANKPVQVLAGMPCAQLPFGAAACDHLEESVFPIETLGKRYIVARPSGPLGNVAPHIVRLYGNVDNTTLSYPGGAPPGAPTTINAGQVVQLDTGGTGTAAYLSQDFEVIADHELSVGVFLLGGSIVDPNAVNTGKGDPSQSFATSVEQFRRSYAFLAPTDFTTSFVDIVTPKTATLVLDGETIEATIAPVPGDAEYGIVRVALGAGTGGAHVLEASAPVGIQVMGYGQYSSYQYPGGSNLKVIAKAPPPIQ
jgi:hypothetical protein